MKAPRWFRLLVLALTLALGTTSVARATNLPIRPVTFASGPGYSMVASGTITTIGNSSTISGWNAVVSTNTLVAHYTPANTSNMSGTGLRCDGTNLTVDTSPDGFQDGGVLFFRSPNPYQDFGVSVADFTGLNVAGGQAMYMAGAAFDFLALNQPNNIHYVAATRSVGNIYVLSPVVFLGGVTVRGTITTDGTIGVLAPNHIVSWDLTADEVIEDLFVQGNSVLLSGLVGLDAGGALTVLNPNGYLTFSKGSIGGHPYALMLADFTSQSPAGGQAGYFHGSLSVDTVNLNAPLGPWVITDRDPAAVGDPSLVASGPRVSPNPARVATRVEYSLGSSGPVSVELFDLLGRRVRRVAEASQSAGPHAVRVDVNDLPSGIYLCRLQADGGVTTSKLIVRR